MSKSFFSKFLAAAVISLSMSGCYLYDHCDVYGSYCGHDTDCYTDNDCPRQQRCDRNRGLCVPYKSCPEECPSEPFCNPTTGLCQDITMICDKHQDCPSQYACVNKLCVVCKAQDEHCRSNVECLLGSDCPSGLCVNGKCAPKRTCNVDKDCPEQQYCDHNTGLCIPYKSCPAECPSEPFCDPMTGLCKDITMLCNKHQDCPSQYACVNELCVPCKAQDEHCRVDVECLLGSDCPSGLCLDGKCIPKPECQADKDCKDGEICKENKCAPKPECLADKDCKDGEICKENKCAPKPECLADKDCKDGEICQGNKCIVKPECLADKDCKDGFVCKENNCVEKPECSVNTDCPKGKICGPHQKCILKPQCQVNEDCGEGKICNGHKRCVEKPVCSADKDCGEAKFCVLNTCIECRINKECKNPELPVCINGQCSIF